jgi:2-dehydro-3-deoxyphosphooctonate aldolase (KDO 8-P synthase)
MSPAATREVRIGDVVIGANRPLALISGPCVIEEKSVMAAAAENLKRLSEKLRIAVVFKSSFEKDNRGSEKSYNGPGLVDGLKTLAWIREEYRLPVLSDVHRISDVGPAAEVLDVLQIPAYLCQQTSLLLAAGATGRAVNVKKGQFLAPATMASAVGKLESTGNRSILLTERGTCFGYNNLVADVTSVPIMQSLGVPVVFDAGHVVRKYGVPSKDPDGGSPQFIPHLVRAGVAAGSDAVFLEAHPRPSEAKCDAATQVTFEQLERIVLEAQELASVVRKWASA